MEKIYSLAIPPVTPVYKIQNRKEKNPQGEYRPKERQEDSSEVDYDSDLGKKVDIFA